MKTRISTLFSILLLLGGGSVIAQTLSISYSGSNATISRTDPPEGIIYYWQGTSCETSTSNSDATYVVTTDGEYFLRAYNSSSSTWAGSCVSTTVEFGDITPPVLSNVTTGSVNAGDAIAATSNEDGTIYLVPQGTSANASSISSAAVATAACSANVAVSLSTSGIAHGNYVVYAVDASDNVSSASAVIAVGDLTAPVVSDVTAGPIEPGDDISATSNEDGMIYLVPEGTAKNAGAVTGASIASASCTANVAVTLATSGAAYGSYVVHAIDPSDNVSDASPVISITDLTAPVLSGVTPGPIPKGTVVSARSNEDGNIYLVPDGTTASVVGITAASVSSLACTGGVAIELPTADVDTGDYLVFAIDGYDNVSDPSAVIKITVPSGIFDTEYASGVKIYPVTVKDVLHISSESEISGVSVYTLNGSRVLQVAGHVDELNMSSLRTGLYLISIRLENGKAFQGKVNKQ